MGLSHALAYHRNPGYEIVGLVNRSRVDLPQELQAYPQYAEYYQALQGCDAQLVAVCTYSDSHAEYAIAAMKTGAHVFIEKPIATNKTDAEKVIETALEKGCKLMVGYILRQHPSWQLLIAKARELGGPYVFRFNLNQQSSGNTWSTHKKLMQTTSPIVDCGVHYVDVMCQVANARAVQVRGMGLRLSEGVKADMYNYGHFQVLFADGSVGWYEAGWGPMISETAHFIKDIISPRGSVSIVAAEDSKSDDIDSHTRVGMLRIHYSDTDADGNFTESDLLIETPDEPGHQDLCQAEQDFMLKAITEDIDLSEHMSDAVQSLCICLAADQSIRTGNPVDL
ncbi:MAG: Gfo/Idh/MocA family oxidoreductase [Gammaproteobacteria bacterium]|nr:Gfo/Idh/MocA family oxidoreductase [Gammaproteobacteria bacterium]